MIPRLDIRHLTVLSTLSEAGSVTAAAGRLGITQSAVSHRLREAERRLGIALVERSQRGVRLTAAGERLRAVADRVLHELSRTEQDLEAKSASGHAIVRVGQATYSRYHWLPPFLEYLASVEPLIQFDLCGTATTRPFAALNDGSADIATVYGREIATNRYRWLKLGTDPLVAVLAPDHRLAGEPYLDSTVIAEERYFTYPLSAEPGFEWESLVGAPSVPYRGITHMPTPEAVIDLVRAGFGVGIFSRWAVEPEVADGTLIAKPIGVEGMALDWWAVLRADEPEESPASRLARRIVHWSARHEAGLSTLGFDRDER